MREDEFVESTYPVLNIGHPFSLQKQQGYFIYQAGRFSEILSMLSEKQEPFNEHTLYNYTAPIFPMGRSYIKIYKRVFVATSYGDFFGSMDSDLTYFIGAFEDGKMVCMDQGVMIEGKCVSPFHVPFKWRDKNLSIQDIIRCLMNQEELFEILRFNEKVLGREIRVIGAKNVDGYNWN